MHIRDFFWEAAFGSKCRCGWRLRREYRDARYAFYARLCIARFRKAAFWWVVGLIGPIRYDAHLCSLIGAARRESDGREARKAEALHLERVGVPEAGEGRGRKGRR